MAIGIRTTFAKTKSVMISANMKRDKAIFCSGFIFIKYYNDLSVIRNKYANRKTHENLSRFRGLQIERFMPYVSFLAECVEIYSRKKTFRRTNYNISSVV